MINLNIQYLPEIFPNLDFTQPYIIDQELVRIDDLPQIAKTELLWGSVFDSSKVQRDIQMVLNQRYKFEFLIKENAQPPVMAAVQNMTILTDDGKQVAAHNVTIEYSQASDTRIYKCVVNFWARLYNNFSNYLTSDVLAENINLINYIEVINDKPQYQQYTTLNYLPAADLGGLSVYQFEFTVNELTNNIQVNDWFYMHSKIPHLAENVSFFVAAKCINKTTDLITFRVNEPGLNAGQLTGLVTIDYEPEQEIATAVIPRQLTYRIYTALMPKFKIENEKGERIEQQSGINYDDRTIVYDILNCLFFLKENELFKAKYLNFASEINFYKRITQTSYQKYNAIQTADIYENNERNDLTDIYQFSLNMKISNLVVNTFR